MRHHEKLTFPLHGNNSLPSGERSIFYQVWNSSKSAGRWCHRTFLCYIQLTIGYTRIDIDGNGVEELIFGEYGEDSFGTVIYDIYTISNGEMLHTVFGWERNFYYLCGNGIIGNYGSGGAVSNETAYFNYHGQMLWGENYDNDGFIESVIYGGWRDEAHPWFYSTKKVWDENAEPISQEQANEIISLLCG